MFEFIDFLRQLIYNYVINCVFHNTPVSLKTSFHYNNNHYSLIPNLYYQTLSSKLLSHNPMTSAQSL